MSDLGEVFGVLVEVLDAELQDLVEGGVDVCERVAVVEQELYQVVRVLSDLLRAH